MNRLSLTVSSSPFDVSPEPNEPPSIALSDLSESERSAYESWWRDLDPFGLNKINNQIMLKFLNGCTLEDSKLEKILSLFETAGDGLDQLQFFAMLRLIAHAQDGRKISKALVYLKAPVPHFHANAIDALIKSDVPRLDKKRVLERKSWWGTEVQPTSDNRRSYSGPFTTHSPAPNTAFQMDTSENCFYSTNNDSWSSPSFSRPKRKSEYSHSRSKSAGNANYYTQSSDVQEQVHSSKSSLSLHELNNTGKSLLLTQKFVYQSPSMRKRELPQIKSNPFHSDNSSPFDDQNSCDEITVESTHIPTHNHNINFIPTPAELNQDTNTAFLKYATSTFFNQHPSK
ncbi:hypothetical protein G6F46_001802 [Rhizopus delemar]|uniref:EH domain-containing protein n=2 Tax=Rhizopus TaxID=4842 RepID=A0A9P7CTW5_9FUNG|nr:hypothetical protein G6F55_000973 [Rhizopus delemar]KAG1551309.1 hypothetical protein G6F51_001923 [Rhizopus arrhizus]KAG1503982.1 hypothetical protein G6F54_001316 [Rhizopus delemar]KAG1517321.1 hypothetical protein G6F53_001466 [Rhizopus delemar]KAG1521708.1 hypothetical protein G6F52_006498 [Rhizopus delemar]